MVWSVATEADGELTPKQARFAEEYVKDLNGTRAAIRAGYSANSADAQASTLLTNPRVGTAIAELKRKRSLKTAITAERVLKEIALLAFSDFTHYQVDEEGVVTLTPGAPKNAKRAVQAVKRKVRYAADGSREVEVEIKLWDKPGPLRLAGRHVGLFSDRVELTGADGGPVELSAPRVTLYLPENGREALPASSDDDEG